MHRIDNPTAVQQMPAIAPVGLPGFFFNGDPRRGMLATALDQDFFNAVQEEIAHVILEAGIALDKSRFDQLLLAILVHIQRGNLFSVQTFFSSGIYTPTPRTGSIITEVQGGGGGGAGAIVNAPGYCSAGVPGAAGAFGKRRFVSDFAGVFVEVGAGGAGGTGAGGQDGGASSFGPLVCPGGPGAQSGGLSQNGSASGGNGLAAYPVGATLFSMTGQAEAFSFVLANSQLGAGAPGGRSFYGIGGHGTPPNMPGYSAVNRGAGGGGTAGTGNSLPLTGGNGADGMVTIYEYASP